MHALDENGPSNFLGSWLSIQGVVPLVPMTGVNVVMGTEGNSRHRERNVLAEREGGGKRERERERERATENHARVAARHSRIIRRMLGAKMAVLLVIWCCCVCR